MIAAGEELAETLAGVNFSSTRVSVINATDATPYTDPDDIRTRLSRQVYRPVRWVDTINAMLGAGATEVVECGPGKVLAGLVKRIDRSIPVATIDSLSGLQKALQAKE
jgi:[acyl-carrier-protein] S-malonyltransferase